MGSVSCEAGVERVPLVVIDGGVVEGVAAARCADETAGDRSALLGDLVGIGEVKLAAPPQRRTAQRSLPGADQSAIHGDGEVHIRFADVRVVEEVIDSRLEVIDVQSPSTIRNLDAEFVLFVALATQHCETRVVGVGVGKQRSLDADQRRRLVVAAVKAAQNPVKTGNRNRRAEARVGIVFRDAAVKRGKTHSGQQSKPVCDAVTVGERTLDVAAGGGIRLIDGVAPTRR